MTYQRIRILLAVILFSYVIVTPVFVFAKVYTPTPQTKSSENNATGQSGKQSGGSQSGVPFQHELPIEDNISSQALVVKLNFEKVDSKVRGFWKYLGLADSIVKIKEFPNITIKGSESFIKKTEERFNSISSTQSGQELFKNLKDTGRKIQIVEYTGNNSYADPKDLTKATQKGEKVRDGNGTLQKTWLGKDIIGTGEGTDVTVHLNPELDFKGIKGCTGYMPNEAIFFHELTHAQRMMQGRLLDTKDKQYDTLEEKRAINGEHPNETDYLIETKAPYIRFSHTCQMVKI